MEKERGEITPGEPLPLSLIPVIYYVEGEFDRMTPEEAAIVFRQEEPGKQRERLPEVAKALHARISYLVPLNDIAGATENSWKSTNHNYISREKEVIAGIYGQYFGRPHVTLKEMGERLGGVTRERIRTIEESAAEKLRLRAFHERLQTLGGEKSVANLLQENFAYITEDMARGRDLSAYSPAPKYYWEKTRIIFTLVRNNPESRARWEQINLPPPYDYIFARSFMTQIEDIAYTRLANNLPEFMESINNALDDFYALYGEAIQSSPLNFSVSPQVQMAVQNRLNQERRVVLQNQITPEKFGQDKLAIRTAHMLMRHGIADISNLLDLRIQSLTGLHQVGITMQRRILAYLENNYPDERLTTELRQHIANVDLKSSKSR